MAWESLKWHDRTTYEGIAQNYACHGFGVARFPDGSRYEGEWSGGKMHGFGVYTWKDGSSYRGEWEQGRMHGCGAWSVRDGKHSRLHEGQFISNDFVGVGLACPVQTAKFAAKEAAETAQRAKQFELQ